MLGNEIRGGKAIEASPPGPCDAARKGWFCSRKKGHKGPCAVWPEIGAVEAIISAHVYVLKSHTVVDSGAAAADIELYYAALNARSDNDPR